MTEPHPKFWRCTNCGQQVPIVNFFWANCRCGLSVRFGRK